MIQPACRGFQTFHHFENRQVPAYGSDHSCGMTMRERLMADCILSIRSRPRAALTQENHFDCLIASPLLCMSYDLLPITTG